jgi:GxxExxY protein
MGACKVDGQPNIPDPLTGRIIGAAIEVHRVLGPGLLESVYHQCLLQEFEGMRLRVESQKALAVCYKRVRIPNAYRIDLLVEGRVLVELKAVDQLQPVHEAQLLTYLKLSGVRLGLLINFRVPVLHDGVRRLAR